MHDVRADDLEDDAVARELVERLGGEEVLGGQEDVVRGLDGSYKLDDLVDLVLEELVPGLVVGVLEDAGYRVGLGSREALGRGRGLEDRGVRCLGGREGVGGDGLDPVANCG